MRTLQVDVSVPALTVTPPVTGAGFLAAAADTQAIAVTVTNTGNRQAGRVSVTVELPVAAQPDPAGTGWSCDDARQCTASIDSLAPGSSSTVELGVTLDAIPLGGARFSASATASGFTATSASAEAEVSDAAVAVRFAATGSYTVAEIGAPLLGCQVGGVAPCAEMLNANSGASNNTIAMVPLNLAGGEDVSSSARLDAPAGAEVVFAGLYWSAGGARVGGDGWTHAPGAVRLKVPGATDFAPVFGTVAEVRDNDSRLYYQGFANITSMVTGNADGLWSVADIALASGTDIAAPSHYAGWALIVVWADPAAEPSTATVVDVAQWVSPGSSTEVRVGGGEGERLRVGAVAWEGDRSTGDSLSLGGQSGSAVALSPTPWAPNTASATSNAFNSTAWGAVADGAPILNSLGVDARHFNDVALPPGVSTLAAASSGDQYLLSALTLRTWTATPD